MDLKQKIDSTENELKKQKEQEINLAADRENGTITERGEVDAVWIIFCGFLAA